MITRPSLERALDAAEAGALILTSNTRAARNLKREFAERQNFAGREVWTTPEIIPWSAWLKRLWQEKIYSAPDTYTALLDESQERIVWERVIRSNTGAADTALLAKECVRAWRLLHAFGIPRERALFERKEDSAAFFRWAASYSSQCNKNGWVDEARLPEVVSATAMDVCAGRQVVLWGFDRFTPQQEGLLSKLRGAGVGIEALQLDGELAEARRISLDDTLAEIRAAAKWARAILERSQDASVGIVVPNLERARGSVERILLEVLHPDQLTIDASDGRRAFDISLGEPLSRTPVIGAALLVLELAAGAVPLETASRVLRSSFLGEEGELAARCVADARFRIKGPTETTLDALLHHVQWSADIPRFGLSMRWLRDAVAKFPTRQLASRWSRQILDLLRTAGWPGSRTESSSEHQARQAFVDLLADFAKLDLVLEPIEFPAMVRRLISMADETLFQPENLGAPIQVVGLLEAAGSHFDHLWVAGLHADVWPPAPNPSPFLPLELQRRLAATGASSEERLAYAEQVGQRLLRSAAEVIFSTPLREGDQELSASPLVERFAVIERADLPTTEVRTSSEAIFDARATEEISDEFGPALVEPRSNGGTKIFQLQAACPFRAFAELRLRANELELPSPGLDTRVRGGLLHDSLKLVWEELQDSSGLRAKSKVELEELVKRSVDQAVNSSPDATGLTGWEQQVAEIERERLVLVISALLELEAQRKYPFRKHELEEKKEVGFGGVVTTVKIDRVDELEDGSFVLLDYKSGEPKTGGWNTDRPDAPQLPIYAAQLKDKLAAVAFVQMARGDVKFKGYFKDREVLPGIKSVEKTRESQRPAPTWEEMLEDWERTLQGLGRDFREGRAVVDPKNKQTTCRNCHLAMMCRIAERAQLDEGESNE